MLSSCLIRRFILLLTVLAPPFPQWYTIVTATIQARNDHVRFSPLLDTDTTIYAWVNEVLAMSTDQSAILKWQAKPGAHSYSSSDFSIALR